MYPHSIQKLIEQFLKFPTIGPRTAARFVSYLIKLPKEKTNEFVKSVQDLKNRIRFCSFCFNPFEPAYSENRLCPICQNSTRNKKLLCVVEKETDLVSIEKTKRYKGLFFILGGTVSTFKKTEVEKLRIKELQERIKNPQKFGIQTAFEEVILAFNSTLEGEATAVLVEKSLKAINIKITHLGKGLPVGGELEYADEETLRSAFEGRK